MGNWLSRAGLRISIGLSVSSESKPKTQRMETYSGRRYDGQTVLVRHLSPGRRRQGSARRCFAGFLPGSSRTPHRSRGVLRQKLSPPSEEAAAAAHLDPKLVRSSLLSR
jgi:hypothetical protein